MYRARNKNSLLCDKIFRGKKYLLERATFIACEHILSIYAPTSQFKAVHSILMWFSYDLSFPELRLGGIVISQCYDMEHCKKKSMKDKGVSVWMDLIG